ncbi:MAG: GNAT family N-acetyltransferase [Bacteroidota bacterium]
MSRDEIYITTDRKKIDVAFVHHYLSKEAYWSKGRSLEEVNRSIENSLCFGIFKKNTKQQIGFARVATDYVVFAWIMDLFIDSGHRGLGYSKKLVSTILNHEGLKNVNGFGLRTEDAQGLYAQFGFEVINSPQTWMFKKNIK